MTEKINNGSDESTFHFLLKCLVCRAAAKLGYDYFTEAREYKDLKIPFIPDVVLNLKTDAIGRKAAGTRKPICYVEVQKVVDTTWLQDTQKKYEQVNEEPIIILLQKHDEDVPLREYTCYKYSDIVDWLYMSIKEQVENETELPATGNNVNDNGNYYTEVNGHYAKAKNGWRYERRGRFN